MNDQLEANIERASQLYRQYRDLADVPGKEREAAAYLQQYRELQERAGLGDEIGDPDNDIDSGNDGVTETNQAIALAMLDAQIEAMENGGSADRELDALKSLANEGAVTENRSGS